MGVEENKSAVVLAIPVPTLGKTKAKNEELNAELYDLYAKFITKKKYPKKDKDQHKQEFVFASREDAAEFFKLAATKFMAFFFREYVNETPQDYYYFSCGNGKLYHGDLPDIIRALKAEPATPKIQEDLQLLERYLPQNATNGMRQKLQDTRQNSPLDNEEASPPSYSA